MPRLAFEDIRVTYTIRSEDGPKDLVAVDGVSLVLEPGSTLGLAGESGCGKSTLAMSVLRLLPTNARVEGRILLGDENVSDLSWGRLRAVRWTSAAVVFQGAMHSLNPVQRIGDQIEEALRIHARELDPAYAEEKLRRARVTELLGLVDLPRAKAQSYPHELSGGQKQRVMIAMALACEPELIIADEPTTALDVIVQDQVLQVLSGLVASRGLSLVMISHDLSVLASTCERIVVMQNGRIVEEGPSASVMHAPQHPHTQALAAAFPTIGDPASRLSLPGYAAAPASPDPDAAPVLEARDVSVSFAGRGAGTVNAVDGVSLACRRGEIVALVGQSGSGKTTLARTLLGLQKPTGGELLFDGRPLPHRRRALKAYRRAVQFVLQDPSAALNPKHTVYESVAEGPRLHKLPGDEAQLVAQALAKAELSPPERFGPALPQELSGGQRQRVVIAGALALDPEFLVADEPVASLDASVRAEILALLLRLRSEFGLGALVITHDLGLAWNIADRVVVMYQGKIVEEGPVEKVLLDPQHEYTRRLLSVVPTAGGAAGDGASVDGASVDGASVEEPA
ncbi:ABC transporter ATP-binding protein [Arthrobacter gandavensis]|uniref:dipeptide ABC transporter ATP-binding protein n=1 Tax=Arthrobacter gandavensis TaxID=169960 RepID=UPI00188FFC28|nr:ABC transporter ATP-binding protein [Arthrobacter gandavensis]MBF4993292.1 ABC transporter ATP-binding protein [Arthrobacter gandavensis]